MTTTDPAGPNHDDARRQYVACAVRVAHLAASHADDLALPIRACPGWSGRDLVGHLAGIARDWVSGNLDGYASPAWTAAQVAAMSTLDVDALVATWHEAIHDLDRAEPHPVLGAPWRWLAGDALCHEADLVESLGWPLPPGDAVRFGLDSVIPRWRGALDDAGAPPLEVRPDGERARPVGRRATAGEQVATVSVPPVELWRALYGRRTRTSMARWAWSADPAPWLDAGLPYPFSVPTDAPDT